MFLLFKKSVLSETLYKEILEISRQKFPSNFQNVNFSVLGKITTIISQIFMGLYLILLVVHIHRRTLHIVFISPNMVESQPYD